MRGLIFLWCFLSLLISHNTFAASQKQLMVFCPYSFGPVMNLLVEKFEARYPQVKINYRFLDSWAALRQAQEADLVVSADAYFLKRFWGGRLSKVTVFATDSLVLAASDPLRADVLGPGNWVEVLAEKHTRWGFPSPESSTLGYQALAALTLWSMEHGFKGLNLVKNLLEKDLGIRVTCCKVSGWELLCPRPLKGHKNHVVIAPEEVIFKQFRAGNLYFIFLYKSMARRWRFLYFDLPVTQSLGSSLLAARYEQVNIVFPRGNIRGEPILYAIGVVRESPRRKWAQKFRDFLLSPAGETCLKAGGLPLVTPYEL